MKYFVIVGEASGDVHASKLLKEIAAADPEADFRFWGGDRMAEVVGADKMLSHYRQGAFMGFWEVIKNLGAIARRFAQCKRDILDFQPDVVILVDFAGFNMKMAKFVKQQGIKCFYYIAPKVWAWDERRVLKLRKYVDELFCIFPFEVDYFRKWGIEAHFFGNPIMEEIIQKREQVSAPEQFLDRNNLEHRPIIALLAGSRRQEVELNLPFMGRVAEQMPNYQFVVAAVDWLDKSLYQRVIQNSAPNIKVVYNQTYDTLLSSKAAIVTSGTATLETALLGVPEVVCYKCSKFNYAIAKQFVKVKFISLVNIIMDKAVVMELINNDMTVERTKQQLESIMQGGNQHEQISADYRELYQKMGDSNASKLIAQKMVQLTK